MVRKQKILIIIAAVIGLLIIGVIIPKLTVHDLVPVKQNLKQCVNSAIKTHYDNPFERLVLFLGKSRIVSALHASAEIESFTIFRIPLGVLRGQPNAKLGVFCNLIGDWRAETTADLYILSPDKVPAGWYIHRLNDSQIILTKQEILPDVGHNKSYAYDEQIDMSISKFDGNPQRPEDWSQLNWTNDKALVKEKSWTYVSNMPALRIRHEAGGANGGQITWYLFSNDRVYELSLYFPNDLPNNETFSDFVYHYGEQISQANISALNIKWLTYESKEYGFALDYPENSIQSKYWTNMPEGLAEDDVLSPNEMLVKNNNFYLNQKYNLEFDWQNKRFIKTENTFIPEYKGKPDYGFSWHIVVVKIDNEKDLDKLIKQKYGPGCSYLEKNKTNFSDTYDVKIKGDGKDLGSTECPVNYEYHIKYNPVYKKVAFWHTGQECQIGLNFANCFDQKISDSFHFID